MENWILYSRPAYTALPWPYEVPWDQWLQAPPELQHATDDFGQVSPCDGQLETCAVPAHLPRGVPRGVYRTAVHHDADWLYILLEAHDPPAVPGMTQPPVPSPSGVNLASADGRWMYHFVIDDAGEKRWRTGSNVAPPRHLAPPPREMDWDASVVKSHGRLHCAWRISRLSIADCLIGPVVRMSVSRAALHAVQMVAWGSPCIWSPRLDEMICVELADQPRALHEPTLRRLELAYDPATETGGFKLHWEGIYGPGDQLPDVTGRFHPVFRKAAQIHWQKGDFRVNGRMTTFDVMPRVDVAAHVINDGINVISATGAGGSHVRVHLEKQSGNRIACSPLPPAPARSTEWVKQQIDRECQAALQEAQERWRRREPVQFAPWGTYRASSLGRACHYFQADPRLLDVVGEVADMVVSRQRPDGTLNLLHLKPHEPDAPRWAGGAYDTGPAGELLVLASWLLNEPRYLLASERLVDAYQTYRVELNHNYAGFALYHLVEHHRLTRDSSALQHAIYYARHCAANHILPLGFQPAHNYYSVYGSITLRGMAILCAVLPHDDPYRAVLRELCLRMTNQLITRQQPGGRFDARDRNRIGSQLFIVGLFSVAMLLGAEDADRLDGVIQRLLQVPEEELGTDLFVRIADNDLIRYYAVRDDLLAGRAVDVFALR